MAKLESKLAKILALNSGFSIINAAIMLLMPAKIAELLLVPNLNILGQDAGMIMLVLGAGLLIFGLFVGFIAFNLTKYYKQTFDIVLADWAWIVLSILIISFAGVMTAIGTVYFAIVAIIVAIFAWLQFINYQPNNA